MNDVDLDPKITQFVKRLETLEPGDRARFKRNAGRCFAEARDVSGLFYRLLPYGVAPQEEEMYFLVATLFPLASGGGKENFGGSLRSARKARENTKGLDRRIETLLDADDSQLSFRLRQAVHYLQSNRIPINWELLLSDLLHWTHPERYVQRHWARSYFSQTQS